MYLEKYCQCFSQIDIIRINNCGIFLEYIIMSDISIGDGTKIRKTTIDLDQYDVQRSKYKRAWEFPYNTVGKTWQFSLVAITN